MTDPTDGPVDPRRGPRRWWVVLVAAVVAVAALVGAGAIGRSTASAGTPGDTSAEAGFARDMQDHHAQAVQMSLIIRDRTDDPTIRAIAYDIAVTQTQERGQMFAWLELWGLRQASTQPAMAWMTHDEAAGHSGGHDGHGGTGMDGMDSPATLTSATMPGMASSADISALQKLSGKAAEIRFLQLMIAHHEGGVHMAQGVLELSDRPEVVTLAKRMVTNQEAEIRAMKDLLSQRGA